MKLVAQIGLVALSAILSACSAPSPDAGDNASSALVSDIASMTQNADGTFEVTCKDGHVEHSVTADAIHSDAVCQPRKPRYDCSVEFYNRTSSDSYVAGQQGAFFDGYPNFSMSLAQGTPVEATLSATPANHADGTPSTTDGYFTFVLKNVATGASSYTQAEVSLTALGVKGQASLEAGYLQVDEPDFTFAGKTYNLVWAYCYISAAPN
jgi:hypothetical protein